jgi:hypothetical protein
MTRYRNSAILVAAAALAGVAVAAAATAPSWHPGVTVTPKYIVTTGAVNARGDALATNATPNGGPTVVVSSRSGTSGTWNTTVLAARQNPWNSVAVGINDSGAGVVAWRPYYTRIFAAYRSTRTGRWQISSVPYGWPAGGTDEFDSPTASVAANGAVNLAWVDHEHTGWAVRSAFKSGPRAAWRASTGFVVPIPSGSRVRDMHVTGNAEGDAVATWRITPAASPTGTVYVAVRAARGAWGAPHALAGVSGSVPAIALASNGRTAVAWSTWHVVEGVRVYDARLSKSLARTGAWTSPVWLATGTVASLAINAHGALAALFTEPRATPRTYVVSAAVSTNGSTWSPMVVLSRGGAAQLQVTLSDMGQAVGAFAATGANGLTSVRLATSGLTGHWTGTTLAGQRTVGLAANRTLDALALTHPHNGTLAATWDPPVGGK